MAGSCPICQQRRGRRFCPGLSASRWRSDSQTICPRCCGVEREVTIDCPADCPFLVSAHRYERERRVAPTTVAFPQVTLERDFLDEHQQFVASLGRLIAQHVQAHPEVHDPDALVALEALARGYQTLESGLYYEQLPETGSAQGLYAALQNFIALWQQGEVRQAGALASSLRPGDILRTLVFLRRVGDAHANGRPLGRGFVGFLQAQFPDLRETPPGPPLIIPAS